MKRKVFGVILAAVVPMLALGVVCVNNVYAADPECSILKDSKGDCLDTQGILDLVKAVLEILVGAGGVIGILIMGIQYMTAGDNAAQMTKAKSRIIQIVIGLAIFAAIDVIVTFLGV